MQSERRLEAVAFRSSDHSASIATIGAGEDDEEKIGARVGELLANSEGCGIREPGKPCARCGETPGSAALPSDLLLKHVLDTTLIERQTCPTAPRFWHWHNVGWPEIVQRQTGVIVPCEGEAEEEEEDWRLLGALAGGCLLAGLAAFFMERAGMPGWAVVCAYLLSYLSGGFDAATESFERIRKGQLDVHFLMLAVAGGAAAIGAWGEGALLLFLFSASGAMEAFAMGRTRREIGALYHGAPKTALVVRAEGEEELPVEQLRPGMTVRVLEGAQIPVDLEVTAGESECDESSLTGESRPVRKQAGDEAFAGTLNLWGALTGKVLRPASESTVEKMIRLIRTAQNLKAPSQRLTDRFGTNYTWAVLGFCTAMFFVWWLVFGLPPFVSDGETKSAFYRTMTLLVVASPCALVLSVPSAILSVIAAGARRGVLFRGGAAIENLAGVRAVAMDKTGTLTQGELAVESVEVLEAQKNEKESAEPLLLKLVSALAVNSTHPLSRAIVREARHRGMEPGTVSDFRSEPGSGLEGTVEGWQVRMGNRDFAFGVGGADHDLFGKDEEDGAARVFVRAKSTTDMLLSGRIRLRDRLRPEAAGLLESLRESGLRLVMLTGDTPGSAARMAEGLPLDNIAAGLSPEDKVAAVHSLRADSGSVAMIGDGVNDAACIAAANVGVAMGARGSDAAMEQASVILMNDRLEAFLTAFRISRRAAVIIRQNIFVALGTVILMAIGTVASGVPLGIGVAAHEGSTVLVVLNSLRLLFVEQRMRVPFAK